MLRSSRGEWNEITTSMAAISNEWKAHLAAMMVQVLTGGYQIIAKLALNVGINQFVFCAYRDLLALGILSPITYFREKAPLLARYPGSISVTAYSYLFGAVFVVFTAFIMTNDATDWKLTRSETFAVCYAVCYLHFLFCSHKSHRRQKTERGLRFSETGTT